MNLKHDVTQFAKDRAGLVLAIGLLFTTIIVMSLLALWLRPSDVQIPIRYNGFVIDFGVRPGSLFSDQWYERISLIIFGLFQSLACLWLAIKLHAQYRVLANLLLIMSVFVLIILALIGFFISRTVTL